MKDRPMKKSMLFASLLILSNTSFAAEKTLCSQDEKVVFSCEIKKNKKIASLCSSKDAGKDKGYVQYRFGTSNKVEMQFPESKESGNKNFKTKEEPEMITISFSKGNFVYELVSGEDRRGASYGNVIVNQSGKLLSALDCAEGAPYSNIKPSQVGIK